MSRYFAARINLITQFRVAYRPLMMVQMPNRMLFTKKKKSIFKRK